MKIADHANSPTGAMGSGVEFLRGLDETERQCTLRDHATLVYGADIRI